MAESVGHAIGTVIGVLLVIAILATPFFLVYHFATKKNRAAKKQGRHMTQGHAEAPNWYPDPQRPGLERWWTGNGWGPQTRQATPPPSRGETRRREVAPPPTPPRSAEAPPVATPPKTIATRRSADAGRAAPARPAMFPPARSARPATPEPPRPVAASGVDGWIPVGTSVKVAGYTINSGLIYVGRRLQTAGRKEPSLIDPKLKVQGRPLDLEGRWLDYWPSYDQLHPTSRAAYLQWLSAGRRQRGTPVGYVFLFMYGLERRVFVDISSDKRLLPELPIIRQEMSALIDLYGADNYSLRRYGTGFLEAIDLMLLQDDKHLPEVPPELPTDRWEAPLSLRVVIGGFAADGVPVPPEWALAWAWFHPETRVRTAAHRCFEEFSTMFLKLYAAKHGVGLVPAKSGRAIKLEYRAASAAIQVVSLGLGGVKDVLAKGDRGSLEQLVEQAQSSIDAYSRYVGKRPDERGTARAQALLPQELLEDTGAAAPFASKLAQWSARDTVSANELFGGWAIEGRATKSDSVMIAQYAQKLGYGIEPDARFGGPSYSADMAVRVFRLDAGASQTASPEYQSATTVIHLAIAVSAADGTADVAEIEKVFAHAESRLGLRHDEIVRLENHALWLLASPVKLTGLGKRIAELSEHERETLGQLMVEVALEDGVVTVDEIKSVTKIFKLLSLDESSVTARLHSAMTGGSDPVLVRPGSLQRETTIPGPPDAEEQTPSADFALDLASIEQKLQETASVSALLRDIFDEDGPATEPPSVQAEVPVSAKSLAGLDAKHSRLAERLAEQAAWDRVEIERLCAELDLLPDGAIDTLNEAAFDACDEPLLEDEEPMTFNHTAYGELQR